MSLTKSHCDAIAEGQYIARYDSELNDPGARCGYSDSELAQIHAWLRPRDLTIVADDRGLRVVAVQS